MLMTLNYTKNGQIIQTLTLFLEKTSYKLCQFGVIRCSLGGGSSLFYAFFEF